MVSTRGVCAVFGFGPGIGAAVARKWYTEGYSVAVMARSLEKLRAFEADFPNNSKGYVCDVTKPEAIDQTVASIEADLGPIDVLVWNAGSGVWKTWDTIDLVSFDLHMKTNVHGLLHATQRIAPGMIKRAAAGGATAATRVTPSILVTGATASLRGKPFTVGFAPQKGAQRLLAQSLARDLGPRGVHVGLFIIDGQVGKSSSSSSSSGNDSSKLNPNAIADAYWAVAHQPRTAWSFETELRPAVETW